MNRLIILAALFSAGFGLVARAEPSKEQQESKEALQELNEYIGKWNGSGGPPIGTTKPGDIWKESMNWGWKFNKEGDSWLVLKIDDGKYFTKGELRYLPEKELYQLSATDKEGKERVFTGELRRGRLELFHQDEATKDKARLTLSTNNRGARFIYDYAVQRKGRGIFRRMYMVQHTKEGQSLASNNKRECIVTGGLGTIAVSYQGKTYYVCCSGCADAFKEDPEGILKEYNAKKK